MAAMVFGSVQGAQGLGFGFRDWGFGFRVV